MPKTIWKFPVQVTDEQQVSMPSSAKIRHVAVQGDIACLWAEVDVSAPQMGERTIRIYGTGHPMPENPGDYIGSFMLHDGALVLHAYDAS